MGTRKVQITIMNYHYQAQFFGKKHQDIVGNKMSNDAAFSDASGVYVSTPTCDELYPVTLYVHEESMQIDDVFFETQIDVDEQGLEVAYVEESTEQGMEGLVGTYFKLPWRGKGVLKFTTRLGFVDDGEGTLCPQDLIVHAMPG